MPCALDKIIMAEIGGYIQSQLRNPSFSVRLPHLEQRYLHYRNANDHQAWRGGNLLLGAPTRKTTGPFDHVVLRNQLWWLTLRAFYL